MSKDTDTSIMDADPTLKALNPRSLTLSHATTSMFFNIHNIKRAKLNQSAETNMAKKAAANEFPFQQKGMKCIIKREIVEDCWNKAVADNGCKYEKLEGSKNWLGTMVPCPRAPNRTHEDAIGQKG